MLETWSTFQLPTLTRLSATANTTVSSPDSACIAKDVSTRVLHDSPWVRVTLRGVCCRWLWRCYIGGVWWWGGRGGAMVVLGGSGLDVGKGSVWGSTGLAVWKRSVWGSSGLCRGGLWEGAEVGVWRKVYLGEEERTMLGGVFGGRGSEGRSRSRWWGDAGVREVRGVRLCIFIWKCL